MSTDPKICTCGHNENRHEPGFIKACLMPGCGCKDFEPSDFGDDAKSAAAEGFVSKLDTEY